ncbi:MAG: hypothetical protein IJ509_03740 [Bacilli bacterium]|nr:hypothetical protein [Bacilli bacterium]
MSEKKQKHNVNNIFYGVIGIATLMIAVIGATFAYYTATASNTATIQGNMATIQFNVNVTKVTDVDDDKGGMIPMSNNMMEQALQSSNGICVDNNGNAVCQVYKITVENTSTVSMFVDGFVTLKGGSGNPVDYTAITSNKTTMRWAQAFCTAENDGIVTTCSTGNKISNTVYSTLRTDNGQTAVEIAALGGTATQSSGLNTDEIKSARADVTGTTKVNGNDYEVINKNYIRVSDHVYGNTSYTKIEDTDADTVNDTRDITSALVYNQYLTAADSDAGNNTGTSASSNSTETDKSYKDAQVFYIVVWLSETGTNQTAGSTGAGASSTADGFYQGSVTFITAQGHEVSATFANHYRVAPDTLNVG